MEFTFDGLRSLGFRGFVPFTSLDSCRAELSSAGVYAVLRPAGSEVLLSAASTGFWHKDRNPAYPLTRLQKKWDLQTPVLYIGKAGGIHGGTSLWERLHLYRRYGAGENATHRGGRAIWQVQDAANQLLLCWADTPSLDPGCVEEQLLRFFEATYGMLPSANQAHGKKCQHKPLCSWPSATAAELA